MTEPAEAEVEAEADEEPAVEPAEAGVASPPEHAAAEFAVPDGVATLQGEPRGERRTVAVAIARFNAAITNDLLETALDALREAGVARDAVTVVPVPGAFELPLTAMALAKTRRYSCVVALGCVIRGETAHFDYVAGEAASGLQLAAIETGVPVSFGVLTTETREQAQARVGRAAEAARTALEMADLFAQLRAAAAGAVGR
jgi:6,7-dimethyl-8-ribityllumazine synthase